jgi:hypothetical protein
MSDYSINSISSVRPADAGNNASRLGGPGQTDPAAPRFSVPAELTAGKPAVPAAGKPGSTGQPDQAAVKPGAPALPEPAPKKAPAVSNGDNVSIHFRVDRQTNNITVFIVDRVTKRVLRSIPPEEVNKLQAGDILELTG